MSEQFETPNLEMIDKELLTCREQSNLDPGTRIIAAARKPW